MVSVAESRVDYHLRASLLELESGFPPQTMGELLIPVLAISGLQVADGKLCWDLRSGSAHHSNTPPREKTLIPCAEVRGFCISVDSWLLVEITQNSPQLIVTARWVGNNITARHVVGIFLIQLTDLSAIMNAGIILA